MQTDTRLTLTEEFPARASVIIGQRVCLAAGVRLCIEDEDSRALHDLFTALIGEHSCEQGTKWLDGRDVSLLKPIELTSLGLVGASARLRVFKSLTLEEHFRLRASVLRTEQPAEYWLSWAQEAFSVLRSVPQTVCGNFSGGEQQTLMIALAAIGNPRLLVLEEPWTGLAAQSREDTDRILRELQETGTSLITLSQAVDSGEIRHGDKVLRLGRTIS